MRKLMKDHSSLKMDVFPSKEISTSSNARVKEVFIKLKDKSILNRIRSYTETHTEWEKSWDKVWL